MKGYRHFWSLDRHASASQKLPSRKKKKETLIINESLLIDLLEGAALKPAVTILINYRFFSATAGTYCSVITAFVCHQSR